MNDVINIKQERKDIIEYDFLMSIAPTHNLGNATDDETTKKPTALHIPLEGLLEPETSWTDGNISRTSNIAFLLD